MGPGRVREFRAGHEHRGWVPHGRAPMGKCVLAYTVCARVKRKVSDGSIL